MKALTTIENLFEKISVAMLAVFKHSLVFIAAVAVTIYWFATYDWSHVSATDVIRDFMLAVTFLSFFIIQKTFSLFSQALHLKLNELVVAHENAHNQFIKAEEKTSAELTEMAKEHDRMIESGQSKKPGDI